MNPVLKVRDVCLSYHTLSGETPALSHISFDLMPGEFLSIVGPSGCGKSTLLNLIAGLLTPEHGSITLGDRPVSSGSAAVGYMLQKDHLLEWRSIYKNILLGLEIRKELTPEKLAHAEALLQTYGLDRFRDARPSQLSGGMRQRAALIRTLVLEPELLLLDEPFSALDGYLKDVLQKDMQEFLKQYQGDMLMVTHSRDEAFRFCNELMLLKDGKTLIFGDTRKLFEQPQLLEAARLTGCKNSSRIERMGEYQVFALDWGISLRTEQKVELDMTHIAIRGHWIRPSEKAGENCLVFEAAEYVETTFEHQYLVKSPGMEDGAVLWWMRPKKSFTDEHDKNLPKYLYLPPEHLMLLK